ncbi:hypothetical protein BDV39DRAFT_201730 [Aspergillus sergii]|uniref:Uncharacterized protein n=1 Tax=Aspergillus sergii TaxID=1034303 RepID=A0A5N6XF64_9EURO|nr:hypothetical protein BDV39DRAFT_201730 [Aspergillus sergii]
MRFITSILALTAISGVSAVPTSNSATSGELTYKGEGVYPRTSQFSAVVALPHPMQIVNLGNASAMGITVAGPDLGIMAS